MIIEDSHYSGQSFQLTNKVPLQLLFCPSRVLLVLENLPVVFAISWALKDCLGSAWMRLNEWGAVVYLFAKRDPAVINFIVLFYFIARNL